jgi:hypothetical protein
MFGTEFGDPQRSDASVGIAVRATVLLQPV